MSRAPISDVPELTVLLVEDSAADIRLTTEAFRDADRPVDVRVVGDGLEALAFLLREGRHADAPRPDLILLDLDLPGMNGREVLAAIKGDHRLRRIPTVILTMSDSESDVQRSYDLQANAYLTKPVQLAAFELIVRHLSEFWLSTVRLPAHVPGD